MRKLLLLFGLFVCIYANGQAVNQFEITPDGINGFVVKEFPDKSASELYDAVKIWAEYNIFNAAKSKHSDIENEYLSYEMYNEDALQAKNGPVTIHWNLLVDVDIHFKEGKMRFDIRNIRMPQYNDTNAGDFKLAGNFLNWSFYNNKGKEKKISNDTRAQFNSILNDLVKSISISINSPKVSDW